MSGFGRITFIHTGYKAGNDKQGTFAACVWDRGYPGTSMEVLFRDCGYTRNKDDRTLLGSGKVGLAQWFSTLACALDSPGKLKKKKSHLGPIFRDSSVIGLGYNLGTGIV